MDKRDLGLCKTMGQVGVVPKLTNTLRILGSYLPHNTADNEVVTQLV